MSLDWFRVNTVSQPIEGDGYRFVLVETITGEYFELRCGNDGSIAANRLDLAEDGEVWLKTVCLESDAKLLICSAGLPWLVGLSDVQEQ